MQPSDLSEANLVKPTDYSKLINVLVYALAVISGLVIFLATYGISSFILKSTELVSIIGVFGSRIILILSILMSFFVAGMLFGFLRDKQGWKLGLFLASTVVILSVEEFLKFVFGGSSVVEQVVNLILFAFPPLAGGCLGAYFGARLKRNRSANNNIV
jgi:hypothetical protein